jgi:hypothetical protein
MRRRDAKAPSETVSDSPYSTPSISTFSRSRSWPCVIFVASDGMSFANLPNHRYGSPDAYASFIRVSRESAAAIPSSCALQSTYATACPGSGWIKERSQHDGPKMNFALLG